MLSVSPCQDPLARIRDSIDPRCGWSVRADGCRRNRSRKALAKGIWNSVLPLGRTPQSVCRYSRRLADAASRGPWWIISRRRPTNALPRSTSPGLALCPGILGSMNSLRNSCSDARVANRLSSANVSLTVMRVIRYPLSIGDENSTLLDEERRVLRIRKPPALILVVQLLNNVADHGLGREHERRDGSCILQSRASHFRGINDARLDEVFARSVVALKPKFGSSLVLIFSTTTAPSVPQFNTIAGRLLAGAAHDGDAELLVALDLEGLQGNRSSSNATPPPSTMPSSTAARVARRASSTRAFFSFISLSVPPPTP